MRDAWILETKLQPPAQPPHGLERAFERLGAGLPPVTWLVAGPGYGKTLALANLARRTGHAVLWLTADDRDADPATLFPYLVAGMRATIPAFGTALLASLQGGAPDPRVLWQRFFQELAAYNVPGLVLALDEAHELGEALVALAYFFDKLPPGVHVALASRRRPPAVRARARVAWLEQADLAFTPAEVGAFLAARAPGGVPPAWHAAAEPLEGWPLGLDLLTRGGSPAGVVAEELYQAQPAHRRDLMLKAALLPEITPEACRWVFQALDAADVLAELEAEHLLTRLAGSPAYRFPAYLRDFLATEAARAVPALAAVAWHRRAATYYREQRREELALPHLLASRDWDAAIAACNATFPGMHFAGRGAQVARFLAAFPPEVEAAEPVLQLWHGHLGSRAGRTEEALAAYEAAGRLFRERDDGAGELKVLVRQLTLAVRQEDMKRFNQLVMQALARLAEGLAEDVVDLHLARACAADLRGDQALMRECNEAALALPPGANPEIAASHVIAHLNLYTDAFHRGELARAAGHAGLAGAIADDFGFGPYRLYAGFLQAHLHLIMDESDAAGTLLRALPPGWEDQLDWHMRAVGLTVLATWHVARGEAAEAEACARRSLAEFERAGYREGRKLPLEPLMWLALQRQQPGRVAGLDPGGAGDRNFYDLSLALPRARALHLAGDAAAAREQLSHIVAEADRLGLQLIATRARLYLAATGDAGSALAEAEALMERQGYGFLRAQDRSLWEDLAPATRAEGVPRLSLCCFGGFQIRLDGVTLDQWPRKKAKLILAALALQPAGVRLADLAALLGDGDEASGHGILKVTMPVLRRTLEPDLPKGAGSSFIWLADDRYGLVPVTLDVAAFDHALTSAEAARATDPVAAAAHYEAALALYQGDLLAEAFFREFFDEERERRRHQAASALGWLADHHGRRGDHTGQEQALARAAGIAPTDEATYLALMAFYRSNGRPERVRQVYWDCRKALKLHLDALPSEAFELASRA
ncbi:MAG: transcriptional regulator [Cyanobacteria bacterium RYN_339]|nr:transcriptional regulator [Cyanobacteria bacterium RYN_339]